MNAEGFTDASGNQEFVTSGSAITSSQNPFFGVATISNISPSSGPSQGGTAVTISGTNLLDASSVTIGGIAATIVNTSATSIEILTPSGSVGSQNVVVTGAAGSPTSSFSYELVELPQAPTQVTATSNGEGASIVSWTAPASNGGSEITEYQILSSGGQTCVSSSLSCVMVGLSDGRTYTFTVRAKNILGYGPYSSASASITTAIEQDTNLANTGSDSNISSVATAMAVFMISLGATLPFIRKKRVRRH
jgi:hypothetical protein